MKELRIFNHSWHLAHQYELLKIPATKWDWLIQHRRPYNKVPRGDMLEKFGVTKVPYYEKGKYDIALLHLDQQCMEESLWDRGKGSLYRVLNEVITDIPVIVINHGTPYYPEMFGSDILKNNYKELGFTKDQIGMSSILINKCKEVVGDNYLVVNSHQARKQWGQGHTIIHGMDEEEWLDLPKEPRVVTVLSPGGLDKYYDRVFMRTVRELLEEKNIYHCHITVDVQFSNFDDYREFLGRSLIYFHPMKEAPMSRGRTEAMLSGACIITTANQDADTFIEHGKNGFIVNRNPEKVADLIEGLVYDYKTAARIGQEGKKTALKLFGGERYRNDWRKFMEFVIEDFKQKQYNKK